MPFEEIAPSPGATTAQDYNNLCAQQYVCGLDMSGTNMGLLAMPCQNCGTINCG